MNAQFLLQAYFWFMSIYLSVTVLAMAFKAKTLITAPLPKGFWWEQVAGYVLLVIGLVGVYAYLHATPLFTPMFWQGFTALFALFTALQYFMPKIQMLRRKKGTTAVAVADGVGVLLLAPMFATLIRLSS